jgi:CheY-like chemotaxis protein
MSEVATMSPIVLVVDDNEDNLQIVSRMLLGRGFEVRTARDGKSALKSVEQQLPDVVLLDIMMPEMDGMEVLDRLRANPVSASLPVILVTGKAQDEDVLAGYKYGADYYITKPFTARQLLHGINLVLGDKRSE